MDATEEVKVMMVVVERLEPEDGLRVEVEVEEYQVPIWWMKHSILTFRCMPTVCSAQPYFFFFRCYHSHYLFSST